jgi:hypothetical protein
VSNVLTKFNLTHQRKYSKKKVHNVQNEIQLLKYLNTILINKYINLRLLVLQLIHLNELIR